MSAPTTFAAEPMPAHLCPPPTPPRFVKSQIYKDPVVFKTIDKHAVDEAKTNYRNFRELIWNLVYRKHFNQLEKARAVFRWMTEKNMYTIMFNSELPGTPEAVIGGFKDGKTTYAKIFECLCSYAGLHCVTISGWAKGVDYKPGFPITQGPFNHSWNAVFIDGNWQLVDSHWATRYLQSERNSPENLVYQYDDFYFLTEPSQLVYSHCPEDIVWQLCHPAKSRSEYEEFPLVKSFFFTVGMEFLQQKRGVVSTKKGLTTVTLGYTQPTMFTYKLTYGEGAMESLAGVPLKRYIIQETTTDRVTFYLRAPREGVYYLTIFAQKSGPYIKVENVFKAACEYKLICDQAASDARPYPLCNDSNWGPGTPVQQYGLTPSHKTAILPVPNGVANISFNKSRDVRLYARLNREGMDPDLLESCVELKEQDDVVHITARLPTHGEYGLEIYANEPAKEGDTFTHICQYLCSYLEKDFRAQYGQVYDRADLAYATGTLPLNYDARLPTHGEYGLEIYANEPAKEGDTFTHICQYLCSYLEKDFRAQYGQVYDRADLAYATGTLLLNYDGSFTSDQGYQSLGRGSAMTAPGGRGSAYGSQQQLRQEDEARRYGSQGELQKMSGQMSGMSLNKQGSGPAMNRPPGQRGPDDFPLPPPEMMDRTHQQRLASAGGQEVGAGYAADSRNAPYGSQQRYPGRGAGAGGNNGSTSNLKPLEVVYKEVGGGGPSKSATLPNLTQSQQKAEEPRHPPIEISYVSSPSGTLTKNQGRPGAAPGSDASRTGVQLSYVGASPTSQRKQLGADDSMDSLQRKKVPPGTLPKPDKVKLAQKLAGSSDSTGSVSSSSSLDSLHRSREALAPVNGGATGAVSGAGAQQQQQGAPADSTNESQGLGHGGGGGSSGSLDGARDRPNGMTSSTTLPVGGAYNARTEALLGSRARSGDVLDLGADDSFPPPPPPESLPPPPPASVTSQEDLARKKAAQKSPAFTHSPYSASTGQTYQERYPFGRRGPGAGAGDAGSEGNQATAGLVVQRPTAEPEKEYTPHQPKKYTTSIQLKASWNFRPQPITVQAAEPEPEPVPPVVAPKPPAPENFRPQPIASQAVEPEPEPVAPVVAPKPFKDVAVFQNVDTHAVEVSKEEHKSFRDLVWHLIYARDITNELEKARAIFLWLCSKDLTKLRFDDVAKGSPEEILLNLKNGKTTYAVVYETLCSYAGLHCKTISGYAKGAEYKPGMRFKGGEQGQHSWNGVLVEGAWRLVDCHWAARRLVGKKVTVENVRYELDEYYFMPDPHQLIFTHFPDNPSWQLFERPIQLTDFESLVPVKSAFFKYELQILSHQVAVIHTEREVTVRIACPMAHAHWLAFTFTLTTEDGGEDFQGTKLTRFGMQEMVDNVSFFTIRPPAHGNYRLIMYAKDLRVDSKEGVYGGVCEYELVCDAAPTPLPFPPCVHSSWGPGDSVSRYNLEPQQKGAIFSTVGGQAEVRFKVPTQLRFTAKLKAHNRSEQDLVGYVLYRVVQDVAIFTVYAPGQGEYGLEIYANDPEKDGNSLYHAYQYLIICMEDIRAGSVQPLPTLVPGYLGPQPAFTKLGLSALTHPDPLVQSERGQECVAFSMARPLRMTSQLIHVPGARGGKEEDLSDYVLQQGMPGTVSFQIRVPRPGMYKLQLYGLPYDDSSESLPGVYNYLLNCTGAPSPAPHPYPKQYGQWKEGCNLHGPQEGTLTQTLPHPSGSDSQQGVYFKLDVPKANAVAVVVGEDWTQLEQNGDVSWEGDVPMAAHWGQQDKVAVCANYGSVKASYSTLLEFKM